MHNIRKRTTALWQFRLFSAPSSVKCALSDCKVFHSHSLSMIILAKRLAAKLRHFSGSAVFSCCTMLILYGCHFRMKLKIFRTLVQSRRKSRDAFERLTQNTGNRTHFWQQQKPFLPQFHLKSISFLFLVSHLNPQYWNFWIIFFKACLDIGHFHKKIQVSIFTLCSR